MTIITKGPEIIIQLYALAFRNVQKIYVALFFPCLFWHSHKNEKIEQTNNIFNVLF
jgi:hypothetical protein